MTGSDRRDRPGVVEVERGGFVVSTDPARLDLDAIHAYLSRSYWSPDVPRAVVQRAIAHSLCFGLAEAAVQIGFARAITDRATFAVHLADVYVLEAYQGRGLGTWMLEVVMAHPDLQGLRRVALATRDAHGLYARFGFTSLVAPDRHMEIARPRIYQERQTS